MDFTWVATHRLFHVTWPYSTDFFEDQGLKEKRKQTENKYRLNILMEICTVGLHCCSKHNCFSSRHYSFEL